MNEQRIIDIESKIAFQEETLQVLNDVICEQQKQLDKLVATCKLLDERIYWMNASMICWWPAVMRQHPMNHPRISSDTAGRRRITGGK